MFEDYNGPNSEQNETAQGVCAGLLSFLDTLPDEQPVEGLEEEINDMIYNHFFDLEGIAIAGTSAYATVEDMAAIARHFYELGLNSKK